ncbi:carbohydrate ABC transporter permease [Vallitalea guaymasensis]|uniref:Sugar ABC transporter permease n=1 Tax=Vallitalea guaymasensis TaxID=1185412 RepID=A0A8J8SCR9_9FIRM|nr:sugar ABC transporter permease [Vallitalea guaymasensis]QUH30037.1 sugar ABC transporter permease [Vallitalea guaymasensis]
MNKKKYTPYLLIAPTYILFIVFFIIPLIYSFSLTLVEWNGFSIDKVFVGFQNYMRLFDDKDFLNALKNTLVYAAITVPLSVFISLVLSYIMDETIKGYQFLKGVFFLPHIVSLVAVGVVWSWIFLPDKYGLLNSIISVFGIGPKKWFSDPNLAMPALIIIGVWKSIGYNMVIFIAGLLSISKSINEAAEIDGANSIQKFFRITMPLLRPTMFFVIVSSTIYSFFQIFDIVKVTTNGGPIGKTEMLVTYLYKVGFVEYEIGYASAIAFVLFALTVLITVIQKKFVEEN